MTATSAPASAGASPLSGAEVVALRTTMGLSGDQLAAMLGINPRTVRSWESGRDRMSPSAAEAVWALVARHRDLAAQMVSAGWRPVAIDRAHEGIPPRGWFLAAAGQAMLAEPDLEVEWL